MPKHPAFNYDVEWDQFAWPEWVPRKIRKDIQNFWTPHHGPNPLTWYKGTVNDPYNKHPELGTPVAIEFHQTKNKPMRGRWVPCWNNIGQLITKKTSFIASTGQIINGKLKTNGHPIHTPKTWSDQQILEWAKRHDLDRSPTELRAIFEDAATTEKA